MSESEQKSTLYRLCCEAIRACNDNEDDPAEVVLARLDADPELEIALHAYMRASAVQHTINDVMHNVRKHIKFGNKDRFRPGRCNRPVEGLQCALDMARGFILDTWKINHVPLGDCTKAVIRIEADNDAGKAAGYRLNARFYRRILPLLKADDQTPRQARLTKKIEAIKRELMPEGKTA